MTNTTHPDKRKVREYMESRALDDDPPPSPQDIREQLGWKIVPENGGEQEAHD